MVDQVYLGNKEGVADVDAVVDAEPDGEDDVDAGDDVDGDPPEVEEADDVGEGEQDCQDHQDADPWMGRINQVGLKTRWLDHEANWPLSTKLSRDLKLARRRRTTLVTQAMASTTFLHNSSPMISSVSQAA